MTPRIPSKLSLVSAGVGDPVSCAFVAEAHSTIAMTAARAKKASLPAPRGFAPEEAWLLRLSAADTVRLSEGRSATRDGSEQVNLVAVRERSFEMLVDRTATTVPPEGVTQMRAVGDRLPQVKPLPLGLVEKLLQRSADGESNVAIDVVPSRTDASFHEQVHADALPLGREQAPHGREQAHASTYSARSWPSPSCSARARERWPVSGFHPIAR